MSTSAGPGARRCAAHKKWPHRMVAESWRADQDDAGTLGPSDGGAADDPLGDGQVDGPGRRHHEVCAYDARTEERLADPDGECLGSGAERESVRPGHPGAVAGDVAVADGYHAEDEADAHPRADQ